MQNGDYYIRKPSNKEHVTFFHTINSSFIAPVNGYYRLFGIIPPWTSEHGGPAMSIFCKISSVVVNNGTNNCMFYTNYIYADKGDTVSITCHYATGDYTVEYVEAL